MPPPRGAWQMKTGIVMTRILIADDHEIVRQGVRAILSKRDRWEVVAEAADGRDAVEQARLAEPEIAILDYALPFINGVEAARQIRLHSPRTEVLVFTQHDNEALLRSILEAGVRGYLLKSDATLYLIQAVEALEHHQPFFTKTVSDILVSSYLAKSDASPSILTSRETSVVKLIAEGHSNKETAAILGLSESARRISSVGAHRFVQVRSNPPV
jgi:DNA-binding NarL/FixJ family response regulator